MDKMQGAWMRGRTVDLKAHQIPPNPDGTPRLGSRILGTKEQIVLEHSNPAQHSMYYLQAKAGIMFNESEFLMRAFAKRNGIRKKVEFVGAGERVVFDGDTLTISQLPSSPPAIRHDLSTEDAIDWWWEAFLQATREIYDYHDRGPVLVTASGGTDSLLTLRALKEIGADVWAVSSGRDMNDFDPHWAGQVCDEWDIPFALVEMPTDDAALQKLLAETLEIIEQVSFSNVLMGLCCTLIQKHSEQALIDIIYTGYHADILVGNKMGVVGEFRALPETEQTSERWRDLKWKYANGMIPNTHQLHKNFSQGPTEWRAPFGHPEVMARSLALPLSVSPDSYGHKPFFEAVLNRYLPENKRPWDVRVKCGFYTGSGMGETRRHNDVLGDANMQAVMRGIKSRLGV